MKLVYPPKPIEDLYLSGFTLTESLQEGSVAAANLQVGWNSIETVELPGLGIIARLGIKINADNWQAGDPLGWRVHISSPAFGTRTLAVQRWRYGDLSAVWCWDYYPRLPFLTTSTLEFMLLYQWGSGSYVYSISYLIQDYS